MKKILALIMATIMVCSLAACGGSSTASASAEPAAAKTEAAADEGEAAAPAAGDFKIGLSTCYTGPDAQEGIEAKNAVELALKYINANGGFNGANGVLATAYDSGGNPEEAVKIAQKLTQVDDVDVVIAPQTSSEVLAAGNVYNDAKMFTIGMGTSATWMQQGWEYLIRASVNYDFVAPEVASMIADMGIKKVAIMQDQSEAAISFADTFVSNAEALGVEILCKETCEPTDTDLSSQCSKILGTEPQAIFMTMSSNDAGYFVKQIRSYGYTGLIFSKESFYASLIEIAGKENSSGILFANPYVTYNNIDECNIENMKAFLQLYQDEYGEIPRTEIGYRAWDATNVFWEASKACGSNDPEQLRAAIPSLKFDGLGGTMDYTNGDGEPYHSVRRFIYIDGQNIDWESWFNGGGYDEYKKSTGNAF